MRLGLYGFQHDFPCKPPYHDGHLFSIQILSPSSPTPPSPPLIWNICLYVSGIQDFLGNRSKMELSTYDQNASGSDSNHKE